MAPHQEQCKGADEMGRCKEKQRVSVRRFFCHHFASALASNDEILLLERSADFFESQRASLAFEQTGQVLADFPRKPPLQIQMLLA